MRFSTIMEKRVPTTLFGCDFPRSWNAHDFQMCFSTIVGRGNPTSFLANHCCPHDWQPPVSQSAAIMSASQETSQPVSQPANMQVSSRGTQVAEGRYYVMEHRLRGDVRGQVFLNYAEAEAAYRALSVRHASMLTDEEFTELKFYGMRKGARCSPIDDFRSWWETQKARISQFTPMHMSVYMTLITLIVQADWHYT